MKKKIGIVTDSSSGLTTKDFEKMKDLGFCPLLITFDDKDTVEDDPRTFNKEDFTKRITTKKQLAKTSQTPLGKMTTIWEAMLKKFERIIFIPLSKGLSGQYNTACVLAREPKFKNKVSVFDSNGVSIINLVLVKKAYQMAQTNEANVTTILTELKRIRDSFQAFILPNDITYLARGGRISKSAAGLAKMLKIQPILSFDGTIDKFDTTRTWKKAVHKVLNEIIKFHKLHKTNTNLFVVDAYAKKELIDETKKYIDGYHFENAHYAKLANVIAAHTGLNAFAFITFNTDIDVKI